MHEGSSQEDITRKRAPLKTSLGGRNDFKCTLNRTWWQLLSQRLNLPLCVRKGRKGDDNSDGERGVKARNNNLRARRSSFSYFDAVLAKKAREKKREKEKERSGKREEKRQRRKERREKRRREKRENEKRKRDRETKRERERQELRFTRRILFRRTRVPQSAALWKETGEELRGVAYNLKINFRHFCRENVDSEFLGESGSRGASRVFTATLCCARHDPSSCRRVRESQRLSLFLSAPSLFLSLFHFVRSENTPVRKLIVFHEEFNPPFYPGRARARESRRNLSSIIRRRSRDKTSATMTPRAGGARRSFFTDAATAVVGPMLRTARNDSSSSQPASRRGYTSLLRVSREIDGIAHRVTGQARRRPRTRGTSIARYPLTHCYYYYYCY